MISDIKSDINNEIDMKSYEKEDLPHVFYESLAATFALANQTQ